VSGVSLDWKPNPFSITVERRADGSTLLRPTAVLADYPLRVTDMLERWADRTPEVTFVAARQHDGAWLRVSYAQALERVRGYADGLATLNLSADRPLLILSGNSIEHLLLALGAMYAGVPYCPVSPAYSQGSSDLTRLRYVVELLTPGLVAAFGPGEYARAIGATIPIAVPVVGAGFALGDRRVLGLEELAADAAGQAQSAHERTNADTIAKFLLTSGSAGKPKPVITTQRMLCSNQLMLREALPFVADEPPVLVDWLPWNHTFGGSHNVGLVLFNGGTLYLDDGRPTPAGFAQTVRNLREISPTVYFNVPKGFDMLASQLRVDPQLRECFFHRLRACFFGGAALSQHAWDALETQANRAGRGRVPILSGLGATETAPSVTFTTPDTERAGVIGRPAAGNVVKLAPVGDKLEMRVRGPGVTPGYWRLPAQTAAAFDEEGFYCFGDAVRLRDPSDPTLGLVFDGRIAEDFKLSSGTWVSVGPLRAQLIAALAPFAQDVVVAGPDRDFVAILVVLDARACAHALGLAPEGTGIRELATSTSLRDQVREALRRHGATHAGNSTRVERAVLLDEPLSLDHGEVTDKGSVNQRTVLALRAGAVADLYLTVAPAHVIQVD